MLSKINGYWVLDEFLRFEKIKVGVSSRKMGDMSGRGNQLPELKVGLFLKKIGFRVEDLVLGEQVHGAKIVEVGFEEKKKRIDGVDGLVTAEKGVVLGVLTADCLPVVAFDREKEIIGIFHAGWKGIVEIIGGNLIRKMVNLGASGREIIVGSGPAIGACCYDIKKDRAKIFKKKFGLPKGMLKSVKDKIFLDLKIPLTEQLRNEGVPMANIFLSPICTSCQNKEFFSHRHPRVLGEGGQMLTVIAKK